MMFERMAFLLGFIAKHPGYRGTFDSDPEWLWVAAPGELPERIPASIADLRAWLGY